MDGPSARRPIPALARIDLALICIGVYPAIVALLCVIAQRRIGP